MSRPSPDAAVVAEYRRAALNNAHDLIADAQILMGHQRWPRACSLAVLATEETAKAWVCCMLPMLPDEAAQHFSGPVSEINRTHGLKLEMAGMLTHVLDFYEGGAGRTRALRLRPGRAGRERQGGQRAQEARALRRSQQRPGHAAIRDHGAGGN